MNLLHILDLGNGEVDVGWRRDNEIPRHYAPLPFEDPLSAARAGLQQCELCVTSEDTEFLSIPWDLMRDPSPGRGYLAPLLGGLIAILLGVGIAKLVDTAGVMRAIVSPTTVLLAVGFSLAVGLFSAIYPANRAAGLSPIEALRYE